jgi:hypothetical protein
MNLKNITHYDSLIVEVLKAEMKKQENAFVLNMLIEGLGERIKNNTIRMHKLIRLDSIINNCTIYNTPIDNFNRYIIKNVWCILFESSSGRVTQQEFLPISVDNK